MNDVIAIVSNQEVDIRYPQELGVSDELEAAFESAGKSIHDVPSQKPWEQVAKELVLCRDRDDSGWRFAIAYSLNVADGRLPSESGSVAEAQAELLSKVEELTSTRYSAEWRQDKPGWWSATLTPVA